MLYAVKEGWGPRLDLLTCSGGSGWFLKYFDSVHIPVPLQKTSKRTHLVIQIPAACIHHPRRSNPSWLTLRWPPRRRCPQTTVAAAHPAVLSHPVLHLHILMMLHHLQCLLITLFTRKLLASWTLTAVSAPSTFLSSPLLPFLPSHKAWPQQATQWPPVKASWGLITRGARSQRPCVWSVGTGPLGNTTECRAVMGAVASSRGASVGIWTMCARRMDSVWSTWPGGTNARPAASRSVCKSTWTGMVSVTHFFLMSNVHTCIHALHYMWIFHGTCTYLLLGRCKTHYIL